MMMMMVMILMLVAMVTVALMCRYGVLVGRCCHVCRCSRLQLLLLLL